MKQALVVPWASAIFVYPPPPPPSRNGLRYSDPRWERSYKSMLRDSIVLAGEGHRKIL